MSLSGNEKIKGIILCDNCNPDWASLPYFSYCLVKELSMHVDIVLVTHIRNKESLELIKDNLNFEIIYIDTEKIASTFHRLSIFLNKIGIGGWMTNMATKFIPYIAFEKRALSILSERIDSHEFHFASRIAPVSPTIPSIFPIKSKLPFILGPINGSLPWPSGFYNEVKKEGELILKLRNIYKILPYVKSSQKKSHKILYAFDHVLTDINSQPHKIIKFNELGISDDFISSTRTRSYNSKSLNLIFIGRLVPYKNADIAILSFQKSEIYKRGGTLFIIGDGPERSYLESIINENNLSDCVFLLGWLNQSQIKDYLLKSEIFIFPTIREVGGNVIIEAMGCGLTCIVPDYGGPSELIDYNRGIKIPLTNKATLIDDYAEAIRNLEEKPFLIKQMGKNAYEYVKENYTWKKKGKLISNIFIDSIK